MGDLTYGVVLILLMVLWGCGLILLMGGIGLTYGWYWSYLWVLLMGGIVTSCGGDYYWYVGLLLHLGLYLGL